MKTIPAIGLIVCLLLASGNLEAQQPVADTVNLKSVEVTGLKPGIETRSAMPVQRMTISEIDALPGFSAAEALRNFSGVTIKDFGGLGGVKTVIVRSLGANHTGVFVDGVPLSDAATGQIDLGKIPLEELDAIELTIGQGEELCQPAKAQASASLLVFHSQMPDFTNTRLHTKAGIKAGSFGVFNPYAGFYLKTGEHTMIGLSVDYNNTHGDYPYTLKNGNQPDTVLTRNNAQLEAMNLNFRLETHLKDSTILRAKVWFYDADRGLPGAVIYYNPYSVQRMTNRDFFGNLQYSRHSGKVKMAGNLNFSASYLRYRDPAYLNGEGGLDNRYRQQEVYLSQAVSFPVRGIFSMGFAGDIAYNALQTSLYTSVDPHRFTALGSVSVQANTKRSQATLVLLGTVVRESTHSGMAATPRNVLSPSFSLVTRLSRMPLLRFRLMAKKSFRMPTFHDLYYSLVGNNQLKPEFVHQLNAGIILSKEVGILAFSLHTDVFANRVKDKIVAVPTQNLFVWSMRNLGRVDIRGIEIQAGIKAALTNTCGVSLKVNYTHQQALDMSSPGSSTYRQQIPYVPFQTISGLATLGGKRLSVGYNMLFNSHRYVHGENIPSNMMPSWMVHDLSVSWQQPVKSNTFKIKAEIINLLNSQYEVMRGFPMNGRGFYLTLSFNH